MTKITFKPNEYELTIEGHAGHDEKGKDIVCSAISILFYTLVKSICDCEEMLLEEPFIAYDDGNGRIKCTPKPEYEGNIARTYWTILTGLNLIAENYKKNVKLCVKGMK
jgi:uncharacterized protein YsxB (DUF464 family)